MEKKRAWEKLYETYVSGQMDAREDELEAKMQNRTMTKEESKEYEKMMKVEGNLKKVGRLLEHRSELEQLKDRIVQEMVKRVEEKADKTGKELKLLEDELQKLQERKAEILEKLQDDKLSEEDKLKLNGELKLCKDKIETNQEKYSEAYQKDVENKKEPKSKNELQTMSESELRKNYKKVCIQISKCNLYGNKLMQGQKLEDIKTIDEQTKWEKREYKLDMKKLKAKGKQAEKMKENKEAVKGEEKQENKDKTVQQEIAKAVEEELEKPKEELAIAEVSEFDKKHPRLAKIKNWFKEKWNNLRGKPAQKEENKEEKMEDEKQEKPNEDRRESFIKSLKDIDKYEISEVAEKGADGIKKERMAKSAEKMLESRKNARGNEDPAFTKKLETMVAEQNQEDDGRG